MNIPAFCIHRPAFTIVISLVMAIIGLMSFTHLPVRWIPNISTPMVMVQTHYPGANAKIVETDITKILEETLSGINGIETIKSKSRQNRSDIHIAFRLGTDINRALDDVRGSIERVRGELPKDALSPVVMKNDSDAMPLLYITFHSNRFNEQELSDYIYQYVKPAFETVDGVGNIYMPGKRISAIRIWLNPIKMASSNITAEEITHLLREQNVSIPSGEIKDNDRIYSIITDTTLKTIDQFKNLIIRNNDNQVLRLKDLAEVKIEPENKNSAFRINGKSAVALGIVPQSTSNPIEVEAKVQQVFAELKRSLPQGLFASIENNLADYIHASITSVYETLGEAIIFVWLVILFFLANFRATLIPVLTIPVCLISTFGIMYLFGFTINTITLMAFVLAIGLVVDDAIVMLENINRHIENKKPPFQAALIGSKEIIFPIIAMTLTLTAVYAPIAFTPGLLGILFREFTFTLAGAVIISGIVALTLSPMMCAKILKPNQGNEHSTIRWPQRFLLFLQQKYLSLLTKILRIRPVILLILLAVAISGFFIYKYVPSELAPNEDMNEIDAVVIAPLNANFPYTDQFVKQMETIYAQNPDITTYLSLSGMWTPSFGYQILKLKPKHMRILPADQILQALNEKASQITGARANIFPPTPPLAEFAGSDPGNLGVVLLTNNDHRQLKATADAMIEEIRKNPGFTYADHHLKWDSAQFHLNINREKASDLKVSIPSITNTLSTLLAGNTIGKVNDENIIVQLQEDALANPNIINQVYVRNANGMMIPLADLVHVSESSAPEVYSRYSRMRSDTINMTLAPNYKLADAIQFLQTLAKEKLPDDMKYTFTGEAKTFLESNGKMFMTFVLALVFIYLVLVAQFESFIDPFIILLTVPFAVVGALIMLKLFGGSLNIYSNIGLITLIGLIAKHGILLTEFANRMQMEGKSVTDAITQSAILRLRPILMTTAAMVLGALPLAFAFGPGAESRQQIGLVITGGMLFGTFFSLIVVPIVYTYLAPLKHIKFAAKR